MSITHMLWSEYPHRIVMTNINIVTYKLGSEELATSSVVFRHLGNLDHGHATTWLTSVGFGKFTILEHSGSKRQLLVLRSTRDRKSQ
jgi:hypothetical protein